MSRSLTLQRWLLPPTAAGLAMLLQVGSGKAQTSPAPAGPSPAAERMKLSESQKQEIFKSRHSWALRDNAAQMAILKDNERCLKAAADIEALRRCRSEQRQALREVMKTTRSETRALAERLGIPMPEGRGQGRRGQWENKPQP